MRCIFCKESTGLFKTYHDDCYHKVQAVLQRIEYTLNAYTRSDTGAEEAKQELVSLASSECLYQNYLEHEIYDKTAVRVEETLIYLESGLNISESENRCSMIRTGYRYEKKPVWNEKELRIGENVTVVLTDQKIHMLLQDKDRAYQYKQIVNAGFEEEGRYAYFDLKTASQYPHRFSIRPFKKTEKTKAQNISLFIKLLTEAKR